MLTIEVKDGNTQSRTIINKKTGEEVTFHELEAWARLVEEGYPERVKLSMHDGNPVRPGMYTIKPSSFYVGQYNKLQIGRVELSPLPPSLGKNSAG